MPSFFTIHNYGTVDIGIYSSIKNADGMPFGLLLSSSLVVPLQTLFT